MSALKRSANGWWWCLAAAIVAFGVAMAVFFRCTHDEGRPAPDLGDSTSGVERNRNQKVERGRRKNALAKRRPVKRQIKDAQGGEPSAPVARRTEKPEIDIDDDDLSPAEQTLKDAIEKALDDENVTAARTLAAQAMIASNVEIRRAMVDTLGWFGVKALPELTPFLADPDEEVRDSAMNEWSMAISEIEDDGEKLGVVELAMHVLTDEDALDNISGEYIGADEKMAVESLLRVIEAEGSETGIEKAKETYEFVTGEEFVDRAAAEKWIAEEYEPPAKE